MSPFDLPTCPCCTGAMLHVLSQNASWLATRSFLELGKSSLINSIAAKNSRVTNEVQLLSKQSQTSLKKL